MSHGHRVFALALVLGVALSRESLAEELAVGAEEGTATCVEVTAPADNDALRALVESELDRHLSHRATRENCVSYLRVELIELGPELGGGRFVTARINEQVPERVRIGAGGLEEALSRLLTVVLHNDPVRLRGPISQSWFGKQREMFVRGQNQFTVEAFELFAPLEGRLQTLPGFALSGRREARGWFLGLRLAAALAPGSSGDSTTLQSFVSIAAEGALFSRPSAETSFFAALVTGFDLQRFSGPAPLLGEGARGTAVSVGFSPGLRGGVEFLRLSEIRLALSLELRLPTFLCDDPDGGVVRGAWMPSAALGGGAVF